MTATTTYDGLRKRYQGFAAPTVKIKVDGVDITQNKRTMVTDVSVQLTNASQASGCSFNVVGEYDSEKSAFVQSGGYKHLQLGAKIEVELGYIKTEMVFYGLIAEVEYVFDNEDSAPYIHVECMDAVCLLMKQQNMALFSGKTVTDAVNEMLSGSPFSGYTRGSKIDIDSSREDMISNAMEDDFTFISKYAQEMGYEFFILQGKVYFRKPPSSGSSLVTLGPGSGIRSAKLSLRSSGLYKKAVAVGINPETDEPVVGDAVLTGRFSKGSTAFRMIGESEKVVFDEKLESTDEAMKKAKRMIKDAKNTFGRLECQCIGIPELVPGRYIRVNGLSPDADKSCYLLKVDHSFNDSGYTTTFEARVDSL